ncbi:MAG: sigma-70 family RNA polymerase sigma factor [Fimbriimonadales bacterium]|nr:sigma-70 family RNA polymerase sigma factor [Fimbriimonadales bacterium]
MDFDRLASKHKDAVYRQLLRMCGNHDDAEDVLAESLAKAYRALPSLNDSEAFQAWLAQIGRRTCGRLKRRDAEKPVVALEELEELGFQSRSRIDDPEAIALEQETKRCLLEAFDALPIQYKDVYRMREVEGLSAEETAKRTGLTTGNVKSRLHRARKLIRDSIDAMLAT